MASSEDDQEGASPLRRSIEGMFQDDEELALSASTAAALQQFLHQEDEQAAQPEDLFKEQWGLSQFWYSQETASIVAREASNTAMGGLIACVACPSLFRQLRAEFPGAHGRLFEYDPRFEVLGDFTLWDYKEPCNIPVALQHSFQVVVADPPYLSAECLEKTAQAMRLLACREGATLVLLTGASMHQHARQLLQLRPVSWRPQHKAKLGNEFLLYTSSRWMAEHLGGWDREYNSPPQRSPRCSMDGRPSPEGKSLSSLDGALQALSRSSLGSNRSSLDHWGAANGRKSTDAGFAPQDMFRRRSVGPQGRS